MGNLIHILLSVLILFQSVCVVWAQEDSDPYLWLEEVEGPKALNWVKEKNEASLAVLKAQPGFEETYDKVLKILSSDERIAYPRICGEYIYNFWQDQKNERGLWRRTTLAEYLKPSPEWEVLLDIDTIDLELEEIISSNTMENKQFNRINTIVREINKEQAEYLYEEYLDYSLVMGESVMVQYLNASLAQKIERPREAEVIMKRCYLANLIAWWHGKANTDGY